MNFYTCFDQQGKIIARCQTIQDIEVLKKMGRPIVEVKEMKMKSRLYVHLQEVHPTLIEITNKINIKKGL